VNAANNAVLITTESRPSLEHGEAASQEPPGEDFLRRTRTWTLAALDALGITDWEVSILYCTDDYIQQLNKQYRGKDEPTDVLSFEGGETAFAKGGKTRTAAGDIVISLDSLKKNCAEFHVAPDEELKRLLIHGILHLKGYDHDDTIGEAAPPGASEMLALQESILHELKTSVIIIEEA
jgi:probable rRNA maturation factor